MRKAIGIALFVSVSAVVWSMSACSTSSTGAPVNGVDCSSPPRCANDPAPSQNEVDACQKSASDACSGKYQALVNCITNNIKCTSAGTRDTAMTYAACQTEITIETTCEDSLMDAGLDAGPAPTDAATGG